MPGDNPHFTGEETEGLPVLSLVAEVTEETAETQAKPALFPLSPVASEALCWVPGVGVSSAVALEAWACGGFDSNAGARAPDERAVSDVRTPLVFFPGGRAAFRLYRTALRFSYSLQGLLAVFHSSTLP